MVSLVKHYMNMPPITKIVVSIATIVAVSESFKPGRLRLLYWDYYAFRYLHEYWRVFTGFFVPVLERGVFVTFSTFVEIYRYYSTSSSVESNKFHRDTANFIYYLLIVGCLVLGLGFLRDFPSLLGVIVSALSYTNSFYDPELEIPFLFVVSVKAKYFPLTLIVSSFVMSGPTAMVDEILGLGCGYVYSCLANHNFGPLYYFFKGMILSRLHFQYTPVFLGADRAVISAPDWLQYSIEKTKEFFRSDEELTAVKEKGYRLGTARGNSSSFRVNSDNTGYAAKSSGNQRKSNSFGNVSSRFPGKGHKLSD